MTLCLLGIAASLLAVIFGLFILPSAALAILGFVAFGVSLGCIDLAGDRQYVRTSDAINSLDRLRISYEDRRKDRGMIDVTLTGPEMYMCAQVAAQRHIESILSSRADRHGAANSDDRLGKHFEGACGELAYCKSRNLHWGGTVNSFKGADVGPNTQVRTRSEHNYDLIVRTDDSDLDWFVLVTGRPPSYCVRGYIRGRDAKKPEWLSNYGGHGQAWFVPQAALKDIPQAVAA